MKVSISQSESEENVMITSLQNISCINYWLY